MDAYSLKIFQIVALLLISYSAATTAIILVTNTSDQFTVIILRSYGTMFAGFLGLIAGFLAGRRGGNGNGGSK
jgi:hypothetical protein